MWPYSSRGSRFMGDISEVSPSALIAENFSLNDASIKLWLPEKLVAGIDVLCDQHDASRPDVLRWILFEHVFGRIEFSHLHRRAKNPPTMPESRVICSPRRAYSGPSEREVNARHLGKATEDLKLFLPSRLKRDLQAMADGLRQPLSDYLRAVLTRHLLGEIFFQNWQTELARANSDARQHESEPIVEP